MAHLEQRGKTWRVTAYLGKDRIHFPLGRVRKKTAEQFERMIDTLLHENKCNLPRSREVSNWLADLDDSIYDPLVEHRLVEPRVTAVKLGAFIDGNIDGRSEVTERRRDKFRNSKRRMIQFFEDVKLDAVNPGQRTSSVVGS